MCAFMTKYHCLPFSGAFRVTSAIAVLDRVGRGGEQCRVYHRSLAQEQALGVQVAPLLDEVQPQLIWSAIGTRPVPRALQYTHQFRAEKKAPMFARIAKMEALRVLVNRQTLPGSSRLLKYRFLVCRKAGFLPNWL